MTPELTERYDRLAVFVREHLHGGCKLFSQGCACKCLLCDLEALHEAITDLEAQQGRPTQEALDNIDAVIKSSRQAAAAWQKAADLYQVAIDTRTKILKDMEAKNA